MARCRTPKANVVHTRKRHIGRPDHYWYKPIPKTSHKSWHYYKKQHELSMSSNLDIIELSITCLDPWSYITKFHTNLLAHSGGNYANPSCKNKVHHPNVFCICTAKPSNKKFIPFVWIFFHLLSLCPCSLHFCYSAFLRSRIAEMQPHSAAQKCRERITSILYTLRNFCDLTPPSCIKSKPIQKNYYICIHVGVWRNSVRGHKVR